MVYHLAHFKQHLSHVESLVWSKGHVSFCYLDEVVEILLEAEVLIQVSHDLDTESLGLFLHHIERFQVVRIVAHKALDWLLLDFNVFSSVTSQIVKVQFQLLLESDSLGRRIFQLAK